MGIKLPKMLKKAPSARVILERSIKDIQNGQWVCGTWSSACEIKPKGCAMGLVAINAAHPETVKFKSYDGFVKADIRPMSGGRWPTGAKKAAAALAATIRSPVKARTNYLLNCTEKSQQAVGFEDMMVEGIVIDYNDGGIGPKAALNWFKRALASLDA
jgi:hypothetical protein